MLLNMVGKCRENDVRKLGSGGRIYKSEKFLSSKVGLTWMVTQVRLGAGVEEVGS